MLRDAQPADFGAILALNQQFVQVLSPLDAQRLAWLHAQAALHCVVEQAGQVCGFLLALREGSAYDSSNYRWFAQRQPRFLYIDRVVVATTAQSRGCGRMLYAAAFERARALALPLVACEFDLQPPNPASARFHAGLGFSEVGRQWLDGGRKQVSMQALALVDDALPASNG